MRLSHHAAQQGGVFTLAQALAHVARSEVRRNVRAGLWIPQRRGIYAERSTVLAADGDVAALHKLACAARVLATPGDAVVSHQSAAVARGIPLLAAYTGPPQLTRPAKGLPLRVKACSPLPCPTTSARTARCR